MWSFFLPLGMPRYDKVYTFNLKDITGVFIPVQAHYTLGFLAIIQKTEKVNSPIITSKHYYNFWRQ